MVTSVLAYVLTPITFFIVFARLWVRFRLQRNAGVDDWLMVAALVTPLFSQLHLKLSSHLLFDSHSSSLWLFLFHGVRLCDC
jgi:hypothetical protein